MRHGCPCILRSTLEMKYTTTLLPFYNTSKVVSPHTSCMSLSSSNNPKLLWSYHRMSLTFHFMSPHQPAHARHTIVVCHMGSFWVRTHYHIELEWGELKTQSPFLPANNVILAKDCNLIIASNAPKRNFFMSFRPFTTPIVTASCYDLNIW